MLNTLSLDWGRTDTGEENFGMVALGHRWSNKRLGLTLAAGSVRVPDENWRIGPRAMVDYALTDRWALVVSGFKNGIEVKGPYGKGWLFQIGYRYPL